MNYPAAELRGILLIKRVRELRIMIQNEVRDSEKVPPDLGYYNQHYNEESYAKT